MNHPAATGEREFNCLVVGTVVAFLARRKQKRKESKMTAFIIFILIFIGLILVTLLLFVSSWESDKQMDKLRTYLQELEQQLERAKSDRDYRTTELKRQLESKEEQIRGLKEKLRRTTEAYDKSRGSTPTSLKEMLGLNKTAKEASYHDSD